MQCLRPEAREMALNLQQTRQLTRTAARTRGTSRGSHHHPTNAVRSRAVLSLRQFLQPQQGAVTNHAFAVASWALLCKARPLHPGHASLRTLPCQRPARLSHDSRNGYQVVGWMCCDYQTAVSSRPRMSSESGSASHTPQLGECILMSPLDSPCPPRCSMEVFHELSRDVAEGQLLIVLKSKSLSKSALVA